MRGWCIVVFLILYHFGPHVLRSTEKSTSRTDFIKEVLMLRCGKAFDSRARR
jgi:hypothetical protein